MPPILFLAHMYTSERSLARRRPQGTAGTCLSGVTLFVAVCFQECRPFTVHVSGFRASPVRMRRRAPKRSRNCVRTCPEHEYNTPRFHTSCSGCQLVCSSCDAWKPASDFPLNHPGARLTVGLWRPACTSCAKGTFRHCCCCVREVRMPCGSLRRFDWREKGSFSDDTRHSQASRPAPSRQSRRRKPGRCMRVCC